MDNTYLDLLQRFLGTDIIRILNPFRENSSYSDINCWINHIEINDGLANCQLLLDTNRTTILAGGDVDLKTETLNLGIKPTPKKGTGLSGVGSVSFSLKELSQPFRLGGTLSRPELVLDPTRMAFTVGKFAGAFALGPVGIAALFSDISLGKRDPCVEMMKAINRMRQQAETDEAKKTGEEPKKTGPREKKSKGFLKNLLGN